MKRSNDIPMNDFYEYFANMNKHENISENFIDENSMNNSDNCIFDSLDKQFTLGEIKSTVQSLKCNKFFGYNLLLNEYFIETFDILRSHLNYYIYLMQYWILEFIKKFGLRELLYQYLRKVILMM